MEDAILLTADSLSKTYGSAAVVDDVDLQVSAGEIVALVGPNGSGKTTTMEMCVGLRRPTQGSVSILGRQVRPGGDHRLAVGVQLQETGLPHRLRVGEALRASAVLYREPLSVAQLLADVGLADRTNEMVDRLSGGQQKRLHVAAACIGRPPLLVLDEPTSGLDPEGRAQLWAFIRQLSRSGHGVLASTHDLGEAEAFADRVVLMRSGRVVADGTVGDLLALAGGTWRLRVTGRADDVRRVMDDVGCRTAVVGETGIAVGDEAELEEIRRGLLARSDLDLDVLGGRIRLEDVFLLVARPEAMA